jgi:methylated-DNA-[protein]-cysteine S-methyltransferase
VVRWETVHSPLGELTVVEGPRGIVAIELRGSPSSGLRRRLARAFGNPSWVESARCAAGRQLAEYFAGQRQRFELPVDLCLASPFHRRVLQELGRVPFGRVLSYGELARRVGRPGAARAVGGAMRKNPIPIVVPCHRVAAADGSLGGFSAGLEAKRRLHALEGVPPRSGGWKSAQAARRM